MITSTLWLVWYCEVGQSRSMPPSLALLTTILAGWLLNINTMQMSVFVTAQSIIQINNWQSPSLRFLSIFHLIATHYYYGFVHSCSFDHTYTHTMLGVILLRIVHLLQVHSQIDKRYKIVIFFKNKIQNLQATISIWEWGGKRAHPVNEEWHIKRNHTNTLIKLLHTKSELNVFLVLPLVWLQGDFVRINFHNSKFLCKQECASL